LDEDGYVADLAAQFGFPLVVVSKNALGTINQTLQTLIVASTRGLAVAGVVLNHVLPPSNDDPSRASNRRELAIRCSAPILAEIYWSADRFDAEVDWFALAR